MKKLVKQLLRSLSITITLNNRKNILLGYGVKFHTIKWNEKYKRLVLTDLDLKLDYDTHHFILKGIQFIYALKNKLNANFYFEKDLFTCEISSLKLNVETYEELFILNEIYVKGVYNLGGLRNYCLIDIGMNVGYTTLLHASFPDCNQVFAFEPFGVTYEKAMVNIALNPSLATKIQSFNYGLGKTDETIKVSYSNTIKGNMGIFGVPEDLKNDVRDTLTVEEITIKNAAKVLTNLIRQKKELTDPIVLKVDCEGSEYAIFESFIGSDLLSFISCVIIEWHNQGPKTLINQLVSNNFKVFAFDQFDDLAGMIYAIKS